MRLDTCGSKGFVSGAGTRDERKRGGGGGGGWGGANWTRGFLSNYDKENLLNIVFQFFSRFTANRRLQITWFIFLTN